MYWLVVILSLAAQLISCKEVPLRRMFEETKSAIDSNSTERMMDTLSSYFFTPVKENSIWYKAQEESREMFGMSLDMESLQFIETLLKRMASHYYLCVSLSVGIERAQCFGDASWILKDIEKGVKWHTDPFVEVGEKAKWGTLYNSVAAMAALMSLVAKENLKPFVNARERQDKVDRFVHVIYKMLSAMQGSNEYDHDLVEFRLDQISAVTICEITTHFWKEFEGSCEKRWTTMAFDTSHKNKIKLRSNISSAPQKVKSEDSARAVETEASVPGNHESVDTVQDKGIDAATRLGGGLGPMNKLYKAYIVDSSNDKTIFSKYLIADVAARGGALDAVTTEALDRRGKEEFKVKDEIMGFLNGTFFINKELLRTTLSLLAS